MTNYLPYLAIWLMACISLTSSKAQPCLMNDSLTLVEIYNATGGPDWITTWDLNTPVSTWYGVTIEDCSVTCLDLDGIDGCTYAYSLLGNNLKGSFNTVPFDLPNLKALYLSGNQINGAIYSLSTLDSLETLCFNNNQLSSLVPDFSNATNLTTLMLANNQMNGYVNDSQFPSLKLLWLNNNNIRNILNTPTFNGLEWLDLSNNYYNFGQLAFISVLNPNIPTYYYAPQDSLELEQDGWTLSVSAGGNTAENTYTWYKDGVLLNSSLGNNSIIPSDAGYYQCEVSNALITQANFKQDLELWSKNTYFTPCIPTEIIAPSTICINSTTQFNCSYTSDSTSYAWNFGSDASPQVHAFRAANVTFNSLGTKTIALTVNYGDCVETIYHTVEVIPFTETYAGQDQTIYPEDSAQLTATIIPDATYLWEPSSYLDSWYSPTPKAAPITTTTYVLHTTLGTCVQTDTVTVFVLPPTVFAGLDTYVCSGEGVTLGGSPTTSVTGPNVVVEWTTTGDPSTISAINALNPTVTPIENTTYTVCVTDGVLLGCDDVYVEAIQGPTAIDAGDDQLICLGTQASIGGINDPFAIYSWTPTTGLSNPNAPSTLASPSSTTVYTLTANRFGCTISDTVTISIDPTCKKAP